MFFFQKKNFQTTNCINGCELFNDKSNFSYWEDKKETSDEVYILNYILKNKLSDNKNILHIGVGNSYIAENLGSYNLIDGITLSNNEIKRGESKKINNYNIYFQNKFSKETIFLNKLNSYDIIIDANLKSFACCNIAFNILFYNYVNMLKRSGFIITSKKGMNWSRFVKPTINFSLKKFFYKKLKEYDGPKSNILTIDESSSIARKNNTSLYDIDENLLIFKK